MYRSISQLRLSTSNGNHYYVCLPPKQIQGNNADNDQYQGKDTNFRYFLFVDKVADNGCHNGTHRTPGSISYTQINIRQAQAKEIVAETLAQYADERRF